MLAHRVIPVLLALFALKCEDTGSRVGTGDEWAIYRLADTTLTSNKVLNNPLGSLQLEPTPFITPRDIKFYHWGAQELGNPA